MQHVMLAFVSVLFLMPMILLVFCLVSFTQEARMRDVSIMISFSPSTVESSKKPSVAKEDRAKPTLRRLC